MMKRSLLLAALALLSLCNAASAQVQAVTINPATNALITPTAADLRSANGLAALVSPSFTTPSLGVATATSINGLTITTSTGTITIANAKTFAVSNTLTLEATDGAVVNLGDGSNLSALATNASSTLTLGNVTVSFASIGSTPLPAANLTGTIPDARYAATAALRTAASGVKVWASGAALLAGSADYAGQPQIALDGYFAVPRSGTSNATHATNDMVLAAAQVYYTHLERAGGGTIHSGKISVDVPNSGYIDNAVDVYNASGGYSAIAFYRAGDALPGTAAIGIGPTGSNYPLLYLATNPPIASPTSAPQDVLIAQEQTDTATYRLHRRLWFDGTGRTVTCYGWSDANIGPVGWFVATAGTMGIGTATLGSGDALTVAGTVRIGSSTGPRWISGTGSPEGVVTAPISSIYSRTDGGAATSMYVKESGAGNTGWVAK